MDESIVVSVHTLVYNHEKYIARTIESVLAQQCDFKIEMVIGEDNSPDGSAAIIKEYADRYPDIVKPIFNKKNIGAAANNLQTLRACKGKYIAALEGDDFWCDPHKLQKQVDFLEANPGFAVCFSNVEVVDDLGKEEFVQLPEGIFEKRQEFTIEDTILYPINIIPTPTLIFRNQLPDPMPDCFYKTVSGDIILQLLAADKGKMKYFPEKMAAYRNHSGGITKSPEEIEKAHDDMVMICHSMDKFFELRYHRLFSDRLLAMARERLIYGARDSRGWGRVVHYFRRMPEYIKYSRGRINMKELTYYHLILFFPSLLKRLGKKQAS